MLDKMDEKKSGKIELHDFMMVMATVMNSSVDPELLQQAFRVRCSGNDRRCRRFSSPPALDAHLQLPL